MSIWEAAALCQTVKHAVKACCFKMQAISVPKNLRIIQIMLIGVY